MKYLVTREIVKRYEIEVTASSPAQALKLAQETPIPTWKLDAQSDSLQDVNPENPIDQQIMIATRVVRCPGCDGAFFDDQGSCTYCGLTHD